jgi:hypothetical protein
MKTLLITGLLLSIVTMNAQTKVYPNPSNGEINIVLQDTTQDNLDTKIFDMNGKLINNYSLVKKDNTYTMNTNISSGVYILQITNRKGIENKKIIIK